MTLPAATRAPSFRTLFLCLMCVGMGHSIIFSVLPPLARELGISEFEVGTIFTASALLWVFFSPFWGRCSDTWGRRPVILIGLLGYTAATFAFALSVQAGLSALVPVAVVYPLLIISRAIFGAVGSAIFPASQAYIADRTSTRERVSGVATIGAAMGLGWAIGPALGAALVRFGLLAPLYAVGVVAAFSAAFVWLKLPEDNRPKHKTTGPRMRVLDRRVRPFLVIGLALSAVQASLLQTIGFRFMDSLALDPTRATELAGIGLAGFAFASLAGQIALIRYLQASPRALLLLGSALGVFGCAFLVLPASFETLVAGMAFAGLGIGMVRPGNLAATSLAVGQEQQGAAAGLLAGTAAAGWILAPFFGAGLYQLEPLGPYVLSGALMAGVCVFVLAQPQLGQPRG